MLRLRFLLGVLERNEEHRLRAAEMLRLFLREVDSAALLADFGFAPRTGLWAEFGIRLRARLLPLTPATSDLGELFALLFPRGQDIAWLNAIDDETLARLTRVLEAGDSGWRTTGAARSSKPSPSSRARCAPPASRRSCASG